MPYQKTGRRYRELQEEFEKGPQGCISLVAYPDECGVWTIGLGHTRHVYPGMTIDMKAAEMFLEQDTRLIESFMNVRILRPLNSNQFDALASLIFNVGTNEKTGIGGETLTIINDRNSTDEQIADRFYRIEPDGTEHGFIFDGGVKRAGLIRRRKMEKALFLEPVLKDVKQYFRPCENKS
jgi:lysozyme